MAADRRMSLHDRLLPSAGPTRSVRLQAASCRSLARRAGVKRDEKYILCRHGSCPPAWPFSRSLGAWSPSVRLVGAKGLKPLEQVVADPAPGFPRHRTGAPVRNRSNRRAAPGADGGVRSADHAPSAQEQSRCRELVAASAPDAPDRGPQPMCHRRSRRVLARTLFTLRAGYIGYNGLNAGEGAPRNQSCNVREVSSAGDVGRALRR